MMLALAIVASSLPATADEATAPQRFVVGFHALPGDLGAGDAYGDSTVLRVDEALAFAVVVATDEGALRERARSDDRVKYVERDGVVRAAFTPNDPRYSSQYGPQQIGAPDAWDVTLGSTSVVVCVTDTGVRHTHEDLAGARWAGGHDFVNGDASPWDDEGHGTFVTGLAVATTDNAIGIAGIAQAAFTHAKVLSSSGSGSHSDVASGARWCADNGAHVVSMSLGGPGGSSTLQSGVDHAWNSGNGALVVAATGNDGCSNCVSYPARYASVVAVGCTNSGKSVCWFSNQGPEVELVAPGESIVSTYHSNDGSYTSGSGTSASTPHVAGAAALVKATRPTATAAEVRTLLAETAEDVGPAGRDSAYGHGIVKPRPAMQAENEAPVMEPVTCGPAPAAVGATVTCTMRALDASRGVRYDVDWGDGSVTRVPPSGTVKPGVVQETSHAWASAGNFTVTVVATDDDATNPLSSAPATWLQQVEACTVVRSARLTAGAGGALVLEGQFNRWERDVPSNCWNAPFKLDADSTANDFDLCWYAGATELSCHRTPGPETGMVPAGADAARIVFASGAFGEYTLSVPAWIGGGGGSGSGDDGRTVIRADDGTRESFVHVDYRDDTAVKRLPVPLATVNRIQSATVWVYARAADCGPDRVDSHVLSVNDVAALRFPACATFPEDRFAWHAFPVDARLVVPGAPNAFRIAKSSGLDWTLYDLQVGVDRDGDGSRSTIRANGEDVPGELMVYLTLEVR